MTKIPYVPYADICLPALLYFFLGLLVISINIAQYTQQPHKCPVRFQQICIKIVAIFIVTIVLQLMCKNNLHWLGSIAAFFLCLYLLYDIYHTLQQNGKYVPLEYTTYYVSPEERQYQAIRAKPLPTPVFSAQEYLNKRIVPVENIIGLSTHT